MSKRYIEAILKAKNNIIELLESLNVVFSNIKTKFRIKCDSEKEANIISDKIDNVIYSCFNYKNVKKLRRFAYYNGVLYMKFKHMV